MALDRKCAMVVVVVGLALAIAGFVCLMVALLVPEVDWTALIIAGGVAVGVGFIAAMLAALYLTLRTDTDYDLVDDEKKKSKPKLGSFRTTLREGPKKDIPSLSTTSKEHIYRMTLNLGSVDVRSESIKSTKKREEEQILIPSTTENEYEFLESPPALQPGLADGTKQFKD